MSLFSIFTNFRSQFDKISDEVPPIQYEINAEHNAKNIGTASINHEIIITHDDIMSQALTKRQL